MYDYGWRQYMPDIARWNGIDQLSEKFISSSPYAYVMNNPAMFFDPDGRDRKPSSDNWLQDMWNATDSYSYWTNNGNGSFVGGNVAGGMTHENFTNFYNYLAGGGTGNYTYWTGGATPSNSVGSDGTRELGIQGLVGHNVNIKGNSSLNPYLDWADNSSAMMEGMYSSAAKFRTNFYNRGFWMDNLGNQRSVNYYGRGNGSLIGLQRDYLKTTAKFSKYARGAGWAGYAVNAAQIGYGVYQDGGKFGHNAQVKTAGAAGGFAGAVVGGWAGTKAGTTIGAAIGIWVEGWGAIPVGAVGGVIGGVTGSILGGMYGGEYAEKTVEEW